MRNKITAIMGAVVLAAWLAVASPVGAVSPNGHGLELSFGCSPTGGLPLNMECDEPSPECLTLLWTTNGYSALLAYADPTESDWSGSEPVPPGDGDFYSATVCPTQPEVYYLAGTPKNPVKHAWPNSFASCVVVTIAGKAPADAANCWWWDQVRPSHLW